MLLEVDGGTIAKLAEPLRTSTVATRWSVIVPFFNEAEMLPRMLASLAAQTRPAWVILVDNGSVDGSAEIARATCRQLGLDYRFVEERNPGKVQALTAGLRWVTTEFVATCDADTLYPAQYLAAAETLLSTKGCAIAGAYYTVPGGSEEDRMAQGRKICTAGKMLPRQSHTGGAGQAFRTDALKRAGGFDARKWDLVLEDHEIIHRVMKHGSMLYAMDFWCEPSPRPRDRKSIRWTAIERLTYAMTAPFAGDWFFYKFLGPRLAVRKLSSRRIRERPFQDLEQVFGHVQAYPVCG